MRIFVRPALLALGMIAVLAVGTAQAQVTEPIRFTTSFPFSVGALTLPAGTYTVRPLDGMIGVMSISNGRRTAFFDTMNAAVRGTADVPNEVVFTKADGHYALRTILDSDDEGGAAIPRANVSRLETRRGLHE